MGPRERAEAHLGSDQMEVGASGKTVFPNTLFELYAMQSHGDGVIAIGAIAMACASLWLRRPQQFFWFAVCIYTCPSRPSYNRSTYLYPIKIYI